MSRWRRACCAVRCKWIEDRREHFLTAMQERDQYWDLQVALDDDGRRARDARHVDPRSRRLHAARHQRFLQLLDRACLAPTRLPTYELDVTVVETNKVPTMPVRGAGYPQGAFAMERLLDLSRGKAGHRSCGDPAAAISCRPNAMPYTTPLKTRAGIRLNTTAAIFPNARPWCSRPSIMPALPSAGSQARARAAAISASASATA